MIEESKNKRQIYIWPDNLEFFNGLRNKSKLINLLLIKYKEEIASDGAGTAQ